VKKRWLRESKKPGWGVAAAARDDDDVCERLCSNAAASSTGVEKMTPREPGVANATASDDVDMGCEADAEPDEPPKEGSAGKRERLPKKKFSLVDPPTQQSVDEPPAEAEPTPPAPAAEDDDDDVCERCYDGGELVVCDRCPRAYHVACLASHEQPPSDDEAEWLCPGCAPKPAKAAASTADDPPPEPVAAAPDDDSDDAFEARPQKAGRESREEKKEKKSSKKSTVLRGHGRLCILFPAGAESRSPT